MRGRVLFAICIVTIAMIACDSRSSPRQRVNESSTRAADRRQDASEEPRSSRYGRAGRMKHVEGRWESSVSEHSTLDSEPKVDPRTSEARSRVVGYAPGITLNYAEMQIEIEARVILRQGDLELLAWSRAPVPKEHESILMLEAKPSAIYEALGLMGIEPGTPPRYDWQTKTHYAATGDRVDVRVRYEKGGEPVEHSICDWAIDKARDAPLSPRPWVFCGSFRTEKGALAADVEGTVVTVVDFPSSLLSLAEHHSESNADLWLVANAEAIPDEGTPVMLILRAAAE